MNKNPQKQQVQSQATDAANWSRPMLPETGYMRGVQIYGDKRRGIPAILPISRSTFLAGVRSGRYAITPVKLSERTTGYPVEQVRALLDQLAGKG